MKTIGFSKIGIDIRQLWFSYRKCLTDEITPKGNLRMSIGNDIEKMVCSDINGYIDGVEQSIFIDSKTGKQPGLNMNGGLIAGFADGFVKIGGEWFLLEIKTTGAAKYRGVLKHGVQKHVPVWYHQINAMLWANKKVNSAKLLIINRDSCEHSVIDIFPDEVLDEDFYNERAKTVIFSNEPPEAEGFIIESPKNIEIITGIRPPNPSCQNCALYVNDICSAGRDGVNVCSDYKFLDYFKEKILHDNTVNDFQLSGFTFDEINSTNFQNFDIVAKHFNARNPSF